MGFLAPFMLIGLLGIGLPIAIHLIGRARARTVPFAAMEFLFGTDEKIARHLKIENWLTLLVRIGVCTAIALVLSKPFASCASGGPVLSTGPQAVVLILEDGLAARYQHDGKSLFAAEQAAARRLLEQLDPASEVALLFTTSESQHLALSPSAPLVSREIAEKQPTQLPSDTCAVLERAAATLRASQKPTRTAYLFSSLPRGQTTAERCPFPADAGRLELVDPLDGARLENVAITSVEVAADGKTGGLALTVHLTNQGTQAVTREVTVAANDNDIASAVVPLEAGAKSTKTFSIGVPADRDQGALTVRLTPDSLPDDDRYFLTVYRQPNLSVLLVNGDPSRVTREDELYYLRTALRPGDRDDSRISFVEVDDRAIPELADFDVVALANVRAQGAPEVARLQTFAQNGGGLLIAMGDHVSADEYNHTMRPLLPGPLANPIDLAYAGSTAAEKPGAHFDKLDHSHPLFSIFAKNAPGLVLARFDRMMLLAPGGGAEQRKIVAHFDTGAAALVEAPLGKGRTLLFTSTLDRDWNDLAIHPGYLPLLQQMMFFLSGRAHSREPQGVTLGQPITLPLRKNDEALHVTDPSGHEEALLPGEPGARTVRFTRTALPGFYRIAAKSRHGKLTARPEHDFAVNLDARASDTRRLEIDASAKAAPTTAQTQTSLSRVELWHAVAGVLLFLLFLESVLVLTRIRR